jgi:hypothetical protein
VQIRTGAFARQTDRTTVIHSTESTILNLVASGGADERDRIDRLFIDRLFVEPAGARAAAAGQ